MITDISFLMHVIYEMIVDQIPQGLTHRTTIGPSGICITPTNKQYNKMFITHCKLMHAELIVADSDDNYWSGDINNPASIPNLLIHVATYIKQLEAFSK